MAETTQKKPRKQHTITHVGSDTPTTHTVQQVEKGNATPLRIGAAVAWLIAIGMEVLALLILNGTVKLEPQLVWGIGALVVDLICVIIGSMCWKKANHIAPASKANKVKFWLWNNLGVIVSVLAFLPFLVLLLTDKNADGKTKKLASIVAVVALLIGGLASYDFDPLSQEDVNAATSVYTSDVYWTKSGKVYHSHEDCQALQQTDDLSAGTVDTAMSEGRKRLCKFCQERDEEAGLDLGDILTEEE